MAEAGAKSTCAKCGGPIMYEKFRGHGQWTHTGHVAGYEEGKTKPHAGTPS